MNPTNSILLQGKEKGIYQQNLVDSLAKMNNYENRGYLSNLIDLFDIYNLNNDSNSKRYSSLAINLVTGFPEAMELKKLMKDKKMRELEKDKKTEFYISKACFYEPFFTISCYDNQPLQYFTASFWRRSSQTAELPYFFDYPDEKKLKLQKKDYGFYCWSRLYYKLEGINGKGHTFSTDEARISQTPKYITTFLDYCLEKRIIPNSIEKEEYSFLYSNSQIEEEHPQLNVLLKKNPNTYILKKRVEKLHIEKKKGLGRIEKRLQKKLTEREVYACHEKIFDKAFDTLGYHNNTEII